MRILHEYFRSTSSFRTRIALRLKELPYEHRSVSLLNNGGEQFSADYTRMNPQQLVPTLEEDGQPLTQSLAIIEYLDEVYPQPALLPGSPLDRARIRAFAQASAIEVHPLHNQRVLKYLRNELGQDEDVVTQWIHHWLELGFNALETMLDDPRTGQYCHGDTPTLADICLVPQHFVADRFGFDVSAYPRCVAVREQCLTLPAFAESVPARHPDAPQA